MDSYHAITPARVDICPLIVSVEEKFVFEIWQLVKFRPITVQIKLVKPIKFAFASSRQSRVHSPSDHHWLFLPCLIVLKIAHLPSKLRFSAKCSFFGQSLSCGHYQTIYHPPEGVYLLNNALQFSHNYPIRERVISATNTSHIIRLLSSPSNRHFKMQEFSNYRQVKELWSTCTTYTSQTITFGFQ